MKQGLKWAVVGGKHKAWHFILCAPPDSEFDTLYSQLAANNTDTDTDTPAHTDTTHTDTQHTQTHTNHTQKRGSVSELNLRHTPLMGLESKGLRESIGSLGLFTEVNEARAQVGCGRGLKHKARNCIYIYSVHLQTRSLTLCTVN